jgi:UDP-glucose 4-epimerase
MRDDAWKARDFSGYDAVFHVAGIAHVSADARDADLYFRVNRDLAVETARKARSAAVGQFIFMSSIIVYGGGGLIDRSTQPRPRDSYGQSKLQAEEGLNSLATGGFRIAVIRAPMIYGKGARGNYPRLAAAARRLPFFPDCDNRRSMLHIDNLCEFVRLLVDNGDGGLFFPQNREHVRTSEMVRLIAEAHGRRIRLVRGCGPLLKAMAGRVGIVNKVFGDLAYEPGLSGYRDEYRLRDLRESILATEAAAERKSDAHA